MLSLYRQKVMAGVETGSTACSPCLASGRVVTTNMTSLARNLDMLGRNISTRKAA